MPAFSYSIVVLTFNRNHLLSQLLSELSSFAESGVQVIVVDNCSEPPASEVTERHPWVTLIRAEQNLGAAGRNLGFDAATGDIVICLDDDIAELPASVLATLGRIFQDALIAAVNFKVLDEATREVVNWVHHRDAARFADMSFDTYEITEGAVAFRRQSLRTVGGYPETFFLSHEGPDLAFRLMDRGLRVIYSPDVSVVHSFAPQGRTSWRNYYYDTRNTLWLAIRNLPWRYGAALVTRQSLSMLVYSIRDGYVRWWFRAMRDALGGVSGAWRDRRRISDATIARLREIDRHRPSVWHTLRTRVLKRDLRF